MFEFNSKNTKKILLIITYAILLVFALLNIGVLGKGISFILNLLKPFIIGFCMAFIFNIPLSKIENLLYKLREKVRNNGNKKTKKVKNEKKSTLIRFISILASMFIFAGIIVLVLFLVIPEFINTIGMFKDSIPGAFNNLKTWLQEVMNNYPDIVAKISSFTPNWEELDTNITSFIKTAATGLIGVSIDVVVGIFSSVINFVMGLIFAAYMLAQKEGLIRQSKKLVRAYLKEDMANRVLRVGALVNNTFKKFFGGQFIEAILLGVLCFIGMSIFKMPYALTISVLIGVTALIPVFGAFFGTAIGAVLILAVDPMLAVWFVVFIVVLQQIDGNLIYPRIVGNSVGLPGIWVMLAVLVGGNGFGVIGMLVAVPIASVVYTLIKEYVNSKKELEKIK